MTKINYLYSLTALLHWLPFLCPCNVCQLQNVNEQSRQVYNVCCLWTIFIWREVSECSFKVQVTQRTCKFKKCFLLTLNFGVTSHNPFVIFNTFSNTTCTICTRHITLRTTVYLMVTSVGTMKVCMSFHIRFAKTARLHILHLYTRDVLWVNMCMFLPALVEKNLAHPQTSHAYSIPRWMDATCWFKWWLLW